MDANNQTPPRGQPMSGRDEVAWGKEPPSERGFYAIKSVSGTERIAETISGFWFLPGSGEAYSNETVKKNQWLFGPAIPSPASLTAAAKRVEELEGMLNRTVKDQCSDDREIRELARPFGIDVDGDSYGVPGMADVVEAMAKKLSETTSQLAALKAVAKGAIVEGATEGEWKANYRRVTPVNGPQDGTNDVCHVYGGEARETANARQIVAAVNAIRQIAAATTSMRATNEAT